MELQVYYISLGFMWEAGHLRGQAVQQPLQCHVAQLSAHRRRGR